jgi:uncharacterized protein (TIGR03083 family)
MRPAARLLLIEAAALRPLLEATPSAAFDLPTVCAGWSVRDVLAHCAAALTSLAAGTVHAFTPEDNEADVAARRGRPVRAVLDELYTGYQAGAAAIDAAGGRFDGIGLGEWMHGGDVREALEAPDPYASAGVELALGLLLERSATLEHPPVDVTVDGRSYAFGRRSTPAATLACDLETFVRLCGGRRPDPDRYLLEGATLAELVLFG